jgi:AcrR family transcriptional regulator
MSESHTLARSPSAAATRAAIIEAAERLFRTLGYQKTTVADIARDLRMSPANVYRFFPSKAAINEAICARILAALDEAVWAVARGPGSPPDRIRALFRMLQEQTSALFFHERRMHDMVAAALEEHWPIIEAHIHAIDAAFSHVVAEGQALGVFARLDPGEAGRMLHCTCPLFTHPTLVQQCRMKEDLAGMAAGMAEFCLRALRPD